MAAAFSQAAGDELRLPAARLYEHSVSEHVRLVDGRIELEWGELYEDDGPAAGYSYSPNVEQLSGDIRIRKQLVIADPQARAATLLVTRGGSLAIEVNGRPSPADGPKQLGPHWQAYPFDPALLKSGLNDFVLSGSGSVWIARADEYHAGSLDSKSANRSAKSVDAGRTWRNSGLGTGGNVDGEYCVRVFLDHYQPHGRLTTPVIDLGNLGELALAPPIAEIGHFEIAARFDGGDESLSIRARTGTTFVPHDKTWTEWRPVPANSAKLKATGRFVQVEIALATADRFLTPKLHELTIKAAPQRSSDWTDQLRIIESDNQPIARSSIPFEYEPFDHPRLVQLRAEYKLDAIQAAAQSEFDLIRRLAAWSAQLWERGHLAEAYPPWDALEILKRHQDGSCVGGFCLQYNLVFLQACESFGLVGRVASISAGSQTDAIRSGHEVVEIWSNDYAKWIYVDGNTGYYAVDRDSGIPLSLLELHDRQAAALRGEAHPPIEIVRLVETKFEWKSIDGWPPFLELRLVPRSNFLEQTHPLPLNQGMRGWFWTGHYVWDDAKSPARPIYSLRTARRADFEWSVGTVHLVLEPTATRHRMLVHFDTHTPHFKSFGVSIDGGEPAAASDVFSWQLHPGRNRLSVSARNSAGRGGRAGLLVVDVAAETPGAKEGDSR